MILTLFDKSCSKYSKKFAVVLSFFPLILIGILFLIKQKSFKSRYMSLSY